ncbi:MAG TPA: aminopeptidase, partial [Ktedonobacteraceae bacterium]|nr:aminopeptidase [Ktedonobacteraceae bacterium]
MADIRLQRLAQVLVRYSIGIKKGDRFAIFTGPTATPLVQELVRESLRAGGLPETFVSLPGVGEIIMKEASDEQLSYIPAAQRMVFEEYETMLELLAQENTKALSGVDPARMAIVRNARRDILHTYMQRSSAGLLRWCIAMYPNNAYAQDANMSLSDFEDFVYRA